MNKIFILKIFFIIFINNIIFINCNIIGSNYTLKNVRVLDTDVEIISGSIYFDEPLYLLESYTCADLNTNWCQDHLVDIGYDPDCPPCDYTVSGCSKGYDDRPSKCKACNEKGIPGNKDRTPCQQIWEDLELGVSKRGFIPSVNNAHIMYRIYLPLSCIGYKVSFRTIQGKANYLADFNPINPVVGATSRAIQSEEIDASFTFCPNTLSFNYTGTYETEYPYGTLQIGVINRGVTDVVLDIIIETIDIPVPENKPCTQVDPDIECLEDGQIFYEPNFVDEKSFIKYSFEINECKNITFSTVTLFNDVDIYATDEDPSNFSENNYKWGSSYSLDDTIIIQICPDIGENSKIIYFGVHIYYSTDFFFTISTKGQYKLTDISTLPTVGGTWALTGSSYLSFTENSKEKRLFCDNYDSRCIEFFPSAPRVSNNPLYPVPNTFGNGGQGLSQFDGIDLNETVNAAQPNVYQFGIISSVTVNGIIYNYFDPNNLETTKINFLNRLVYSNGKHIEGSVSIGNRVEPKCSYQKFLKIIDEQNIVLDKIDKTSATLINGLRYYFDILSFEDDYNSCKVMAESLLVFNYSTTIQNTTVCTGTSDKNQYLNDPCCSLYASFGSCCRTRPQEITTKVYLGNNDSVHDQCSFPDCANSVLETFVNSVIGSQYDQCKVSNSEENYFTNNLYQVFRSCKSQLSPKKCNIDSDCGGNNFKCNQRNGVCLIPYEQVERNYIGCILDNIADPLRAEVIRVLNFSNISDNQQLIDKLYEAYLFNDCVTDYGVQSWSRLSYTYLPNSDVVGNCYPLAKGLDTAGGLDTYDNCYQGLNTFFWIAEVYSNESCQELARCDWMGDEGHYNSESFKDCLVNPPEYFCGDCTDPVRTCFVNKTINSQSTCESKYVCYDRDYTDELLYSSGYETVDDPSLCAEKAGSCSVGCGLECDTDFGGCVIKTDYLFCIDGDLSYNPNDGQYYCAYYISESQCQSIGGEYKKCQFSDEQCTICNDPINGCDTFGIRCRMKDIPCKTKQECEAAGSCSDKYFFSTQISNYPTYKPKCLFPRTTIPLFTQSLPTCEYGTQQDTPYGCFNLTLMDKDECEAANGIWWETFSQTEQECTNSPKACYGLDTSVGYLLPLTYRYNSKSQADCSCAGEEWKNPFSWTQGVWSEGVAVPLKWIKNDNPITQIAKTKISLNFSYLFSIFKDAVFSRKTLLYKSEVLCRSSNSKNSLEALSCSCTEGGGTDTCFEKLEPPVLQVIKPCYDGLNTTIFNNGTITFKAGSILENNCVSISIGQIFKESFLSKKVLGLSSTFVTFDRPEDYSIFNQKKATIGKLLADGINLQFYDVGAEYFELCMSLDNSRNSKVFPHLDFSLLINEKEGEMKPLQCNITTDSYGRYCCDISDIKVGKNSYFLIERIGNWENENYKPFKSGSSAMLYILAVFFCLMSIYGILNLSLFILQKLLSTEPFKLVHLLFLVLTAFCVIRSIYFFILPSGYIKESTTVGNYILVVLPTFLYFTAFTVVIVIWYMLSSAQSFNTNIYKRIYSMIFVINVILYIFFIIIVVVFNFTQEDDPPTCGGRLSITLDQTRPQNIVSILYAVLQAVLSLIIGFAFIYYGHAVYKKLRGLTSNVSPAAEKQKKRTIQMAIICSAGFVLHCIFIIILVSVNPSNIVFSFICLIITEIIPVITLFVTNNQVPIYRYSKKGIKGVVKLTSSGKASHLSESTAVQNPRKSNSKRSMSEKNTDSTQSSITPE
ncbi:hypothetical protein DICPUDRAFT_158300 [Dictyostelium purpureum]|uniref:THH1/TOM1/TOM3 domain-containing protein n=1 Tax=Dictyostelium purpureum TaxID=5786 RepID=F1A196_DICPU|nr:uncharacterized protein DICPUDRAFT_158300 [Dictyostelium purpureum]EGC30029.1 hypothetical protein DICPUDRAFT_158300 [Dictyostelium purpureum]|eukprot:XP_003293440.1 hypothetical protein DICPUDRAFT_158300 [Dictyostelium purpureum]